MVIAKTYRGDKGRTAFSGMSALWNSSLRTSEAVTIAEPIAFLEERNVLLQGPVPGASTLEELIRSARTSWRGGPRPTEPGVI